MAFEIRPISRKTTYPPGFYIKKDSIWYQIEDLKIDQSGNVKLFYRDPLRHELGITRICSIEELIGTIPEFEFEIK